MAEEFDSIENLAEEIKSKLSSSNSRKNIIALYAFNATGKTRLANILGGSDCEDEDDEIIKSLYYSVFLEDIFNWDNENYVLLFDSNNWIIKLVRDQGLENDIVNNFKYITNSKLEPLFDFTKGEVSFSIASGDEQNESNIKISRGEESVLIWSVFYTVLESVIEDLNTEESDRTTTEFNKIEYIIIDDPVSSIDDTKIISIAIMLAKAIRSCKNNNIKFLITTHHALFYNVILNSFKKEKQSGVFESYSLLKDSGVLKLSRQNDSPFGYHLILKETLKNAILQNNIERYHFNLFRGLLEKTSSFLGYQSWGQCVSGDKKDEFIRLINLYSHNKISELEPRHLSEEEIEIFKETFNKFTEKYFHENK